MPIKVKDVLARLKADGWYEVSTEGSHRQLRHPTKPGKVTVAGKPSKDIAPGTYNSIKQQAGWKELSNEQQEEQS